MTPEEHERWHLKQDARTLEKNLRAIANYMFDMSSWLIFSTRPSNRLVGRFERDISQLRFTPEESRDMANVLLEFQYSAARAERALPEDWKLSPLYWKAPRNVNTAEQMSVKFNAAADKIREKIRILPPDPGWRGWREKIVRAFGS